MKNIAGRKDSERATQAATPTLIESPNSLNDPMDVINRLEKPIIVVSPANRTVFVTSLTAFTIQNLFRVPYSEFL